MTHKNQMLYFLPLDLGLLTTLVLFSKKLSIKIKGFLPNF